jgi:hypothetical protein
LARRFEALGRHWNRSKRQMMGVNGHLSQPPRRALKTFMGAKPFLKVDTKPFDIMEIDEEISYMVCFPLKGE